MTTSGASRATAVTTGLAPVAPVLLALTFAYALLLGLFEPDLSLADRLRGTAVILAGVGLALAMRRHPAIVVGALHRLARPLTLPRLVAVALALRVVWVAASGVTQWSDFATYDRVAMELAAGAHRPVDPALPTGPSLFFALHYLIVGHHPLVPQLTVALLSTAQVLLLHDLVRRTTGSLTAARLAAAVLAVWPEHVLYVNLIGSDVLFSFLVLFAIWLLAIASARPPVRAFLDVFVAGLVLGTAQWMRSTTVVFLLPSCAWLALERRLNGRRFLAVAALAAGVAIPVLPLTYANYAYFGVLSPSPSQVWGWTVFVGANAETRGGWSRADMERVDAEFAARPRPPGHRSVLINRLSLEMARQRIGENPGGYAWLIVRHKIARLWARTAYVGWSVRTSRVGYLEESIRSAADLYNNLALAGAIVGLLAVAARRGYAWDVRQILFWAALLTTGVHCIAEVQPRYHHMFLPTIALAVGQLATAGPRPRSRDSGDRPGGRRSVGAC